MGGSIFVPCFLCNTLCPFPVLSSFAIILARKRESDCCFTFIVFLMSCDCLCPVALLTVPWVGLLCVIAVPYFLNSK